MWRIGPSGQRSERSVAFRDCRLGESGDDKSLHNGGGTYRDQPSLQYTFNILNGQYNKSRLSKRRASEIRHPDMPLSTLHIAPSREANLVIVGKHINPLAKASGTHRARGPSLSVSPIHQFSTSQNSSRIVRGLQNIPRSSLCVCAVMN